MDDSTISNLMSTVESISSNLDLRPDSWREQLQAVRNTTSSIEFLPTTTNDSSLQWQIMLISAFQRVAFADADNGAVQDVADWCLRQALSLLRTFPENSVLLLLIGQNWLLRAQRSLANISRLDFASSSSSAASASTSTAAHGLKAKRVSAEVQERLQTADYVEARGILVPATDYLRRAVDTARGEGKLDGVLLCTAAESYMSLGNVTSSRLNDEHFSQAIAYLQEAADMQDYALPEHFEQYLEEYGPLY